MFSSGGESFSMVKLMNTLMHRKLHLLFRIFSKKYFSLESYRDNLVFWNLFFWVCYLVNGLVKYRQMGAMTTSHRLPSLLNYTASFKEKREKTPTAEIIDNPNNGCCPVPFKCDSAVDVEKVSLEFQSSVVIFQHCCFLRKCHGSGLKLLCG